MTTQRMGYALARAELIRTLTAYSGITTADGAVTQDSLIDANLIGSNDYITSKTIIIQSGPAGNEDKAAISFNPVNGEIVVDSAFSAQIMAGTIFKILNISTVELDVVNILARIGTNVDSAGTNTLFAWFAKTWAGILASLGLAYQGTVTDVPGANQFTIPDLAGLGDTAFVDWTAYVFWDTAGVDAPPQREHQDVATYDSATGTFGTAPFTAPVDIGDVIIILHPAIANIFNLILDMNVPMADAVTNDLIRDVVGNKTDAAVSAVSATATLVAYLKGLIGGGVAGVGISQVKATTIDLNQAAGTYDLFIGTGQNVNLEKLTIRMSGGAIGGALTSISIQTNDNTPQVIIPATAGVVANLTDQAQLSWTGILVLVTGKKVRLTIAGGAAGVSRVCDVIAEYRAVVAGGTLA